jgi:hypothetical protein
MIYAGLLVLIGGLAKIILELIEKSDKLSFSMGYFEMF